MARKCFSCKKKDDPLSMFIDGLKATCRTPECMAKYSLWKVARKKKNDEKDFKKKTNKMRSDFNSRDLKWQHARCKIAFNKSRVLEEIKWFQDRGLDPECISCGKKNMDWCCGHLKTVGSSGNLKYDRMNTYLQCNKYCNMSLSGNINGNKNTRGYLAGLLDRFGENESRIIIDYCDREQFKVKKWTCGEVEKIKEESLEIKRALMHY